MCDVCEIYVEIHVIYVWKFIKCICGNSCYACAHVCVATGKDYPHG